MVLGQWPCYESIMSIWNQKLHMVLGHVKVLNEAFSFMDLIFK